MELSKHKEVIAFVVIFLIIISFLLYTAFFTEKGFTGNLIKQDDESKGFKIKTDLQTPTLELNDNFEKIQILFLVIFQKINKIILINLK